MTQIDRIIADALAGSPETHVAILAREVVRLREASAVVVPELTRRQSTDIANEAQMITGRSIWPSTVEAIAKIMRLRTIPADRALGDGEVKMEICERDCREDDEDALEVLRVCGYGQQAEMLEVAIKAHDLRANQGGAGK